MKPAVFKTVNAMFISFFPLLFLFFIYLLMIVRINITFYLAVTFLNLLLFFSAIELADRIYRQMQAISSQT